MISHQVCLHGIFKSQAALTPQAPAVVCGNRVISYSELDDETDSLGTWLRHRGVSPDDRVGVFMDTCSEYVVACIGALKAGAAFVPLELDWPDDLLVRVLTEAKPRVVITKQQYRSRLHQDTTADILSLDEDQDWRACETMPWAPAIDCDNLAFVPYTSGTTGDPKGVMQTHRSVLSSYFGRYEFNSYKAGDRVACNIFFIWEFLRPLLKGGTVYIIPDDIVFLPRSLTGFIRDNDITEILFTPSILQGVLNSADHETLRAELQSLRVVWVNGEVVTRRYMEQALNLLPNSIRLFNTYSICETHDVCTVELTRETVAGSDVCPVGLPMDGVTVRILPEQGTAFATVGTGELHIGGRGLARGYLGRADLDQQKFVLVDGERYYSTGDIAEIDSVGMVTVTGRNDSMVKIRGYSVYLGGIEETLRKHCDVLDTVVSVEAEDETNKRLMAYVVPKPEASWRVDAKTGFSRDLRHLLERYLPQYMVPSRFLELDALPINQLTGKLDRKALPALPKKKAPVSNRMVVPEGAPFEERRSVLRELWGEALDIDYISLDDDSNFFDRGGHSLSGLALTLGIERAFGVRLQGTEVYEYQTLNQLAEYLGDQGSSMKSEVSLAEDARLDPDVVPSTGVVCERLSEASSVLITGATGFLGAFLLDELLGASKESTKFYCLTRDKESPEGQPNNRVLDTLRFYGLPGQALQDRIIPVTGDLTKSQFGLNDADYEHLSQTTDLIFHCAASVNYVYSYSATKSHTVDGTREVIKFACHKKTKPIQYISSNGIFPGGDDTPYLENSDIDGFVDRMEGGYNQAKWVAERLMWHAMSRGLPVCMFRPGNIGHHSVTGVVNPNDFQTLIIKACLRSGCAPVAPEWLFEMTPVDFLATFVTRIADEPANLGNVYNIVQQEPVPADQVFTHMKSNGFVTELVSIAEWKARLEATAEQEDDVELKVLTQALDFVEPYLTDTSVYDITRFNEALSQLGLLPPVVDLNYVTKILKSS